MAGLPASAGYPALADLLAYERQALHLLHAALAPRRSSPSASPLPAASALLERATALAEAATAHARVVHAAAERALQLDAELHAAAHMPPTLAPLLDDLRLPPPASLHDVADAAAAGAAAAAASVAARRQPPPVGAGPAGPPPPPLVDVGAPQGRVGGVVPDVSARPPPVAADEPPLANAPAEAGARREASQTPRMVETATADDASPPADEGEVHTEAAELAEAAGRAEVELRDAVSAALAEHAATGAVAASTLACVAAAQARMDAARERAEVVHTHEVAPVEVFQQPSRSEAVRGDGDGTASPLADSGAGKGAASPVADAASAPMLPPPSTPPPHEGGGRERVGSDAATPRRADQPGELPSAADASFSRRRYDELLLVSGGVFPQPEVAARGSGRVGARDTDAVAPQLRAAALRRAADAYE